MKSKYVIISFVVISLCYCLDPSPKPESILDVLNGYFPNDIPDNNNDEIVLLEKKNKKKAITKNKSKENDDTKQSTIFEGWFSISSPQFKNKSKFPLILLPDDKTNKIKVDDSYFRINRVYSDNDKNENSPPSNKVFYFRLLQDLLYYSETKDDFNVLGGLRITKIESFTEIEISGLYCLKLNDVTKELWTICHEKVNMIKVVKCAIKNILNMKDDSCDPDKIKQALVDINSLPKTIIEEAVEEPILLIPLPSKSCNENWNYENNGKDWNCICEEGKEQSPIDLPVSEAAYPSPVRPLFSYTEVNVVNTITTLDGELKTKEKMKIKYQGNAIRIFHPNLGKIVTLDGAVYIAEEIVFNTPSEHTINGRRFDMEMQIVHYGQSKGDIAKQVVLSFLFQKTPGVYNKFIDDLDFFNLPNPDNKEMELTHNLYIPKVLYNSLSDEIPVLKPFSFYTYQGSLTFPPCSERTIHYVASEPLPIAAIPLQLMKEALIKRQDNNSNGSISVNTDEINNNRFTQPINDRLVFYFNHKVYCSGLEEEIKTNVPTNSNGHYEKLDKKVIEYFYVNGNEPSNLPNTFVVSEKEAKGV